MAGYAGGVLDAIAVLRPPPIARARQHGCKLALDQLFDERPHPIAHRALDRIEPTVEKMFDRGGLRLQSRRTNAIVHHGVVSDRDTGATKTKAPRRHRGALFQLIDGNGELVAGARSHLNLLIRSAA